MRKVGTQLTKCDCGSDVKIVKNMKKQFFTKCPSCKRQSVHLAPDGETAQLFWEFERDTDKDYEVLILVK